MKLSVLIPLYNDENYIGYCINSLINQDLPKEDYEVIIMDDGSTDGSLEIAKSVNDSRVRVYSDGKNKKLATRLNEIAQLASYEYIARMDADDIMSSDRLERQIKILDENRSTIIGIRYHTLSTIE